MQSLKELFEEFNEIFSNTDNLDNIDFSEEGEIIVNTETIKINNSLEFVDICS